MNSICELLEWDTQFFGSRIARLGRERLDGQSLNGALDWCHQHKIECLYFLCAPDDNASVELAEANGFHLADIRIELNWKAQQSATHSPASIRQANESDLVELQRIAGQAFTNTRFSFDNRFAPKEAHKRVTDLYKIWVAGSCQSDDHTVFVAESGKTIAGFITCQFDDARTGRIGLLALAADAQGKGYGQSLIQTAQQHFFLAGANEARVVTQGRNIAAQRLYQSSGFRTCAVALWYHKWF
ncbi:MAG: GNAT family N-acetyltransferase [Blastocatellia bacterium]